MTPLVWYLFGVALSYILICGYDVLIKEDFSFREAFSNLIISCFSWIAVAVMLIIGLLMWLKDLADSPGNNSPQDIDSKRW